MKKMATVLWAAAISMTAAAGCSSSDDSSGGGGGAGAPPNFEALQTTLTVPTGTLSADGSDHATAVGGFSAQGDALTNGGSFLGGDSSSSSTASVGGLALNSLHILAEGSCTQLKTATGSGSCTCPNGGSLSYDLPAGGLGNLSDRGDAPIDVVVALKADNCADGGKSVNGGFYIKVKKTNARNVFLIYSIHLTITGTEKPGKYDADILFDTKDGVSKIVYAVDIPSGKVLVSGSYDANSGNGQITVTDTKGTYTCMAVAGVGSCTGPDGNKIENIKFKK